MNKKKNTVSTHAELVTLTYLYLDLLTHSLPKL